MTKSDVLGRLQAAFTRYHAALPALYPKRKEASITLPASVTTYEYTDAWVTADTSCYAHTIDSTGITTSVSWAFTTGKVTFTIGTALTTPVTFSFGMIKGGVGQ